MRTLNMLFVFVLFALVATQALAVENPSPDDQVFIRSVALGTADTQRIVSNATHWDNEHNSDRLDAVRWCIYQQTQLDADDAENNMLWGQRLTALISNNVYFTTFVPEGIWTVRFGEMLKWAGQWQDWQASDTSSRSSSRSWEKRVRSRVRPAVSSATGSRSAPSTTPDITI